MLERFIAELTRIFRRAATKHDAHERSRQVLLDMAGDAATLRAVLANEIRRPGALNTLHFPSVAVNVADTLDFALVANCFFPLPSGETDVVASAIHHHGHMLLTTVTTSGAGYEHWRFTIPTIVDSERELFSMRVLDREHHRAGHVAFVDADMPHAVIIPPALSITFALWSSKLAVTWREHVKHLSFVRRQKKFLREVGTRLGLTKTLALNTVRYLDFYPTPIGFKGMKERIQFQRGPNEDFLHSLFHVLQETKNEELASLVEAQLNGGNDIDNPDTIRRLLRDLRADRPIQGRFSEGHHFLEHMNFKTSAIDGTLVALERTAGAPAAAAPTPPDKAAGSGFRG